MISPKETFVYYRQLLYFVGERLGYSVHLIQRKTYGEIAVQKLLDDQIYSNPAVSYLFVIKDGRVLAHTFTGGIPLELIAANKPQDSDRGHLNKIISEDSERFLDIAWPVFSGKAGTLRLGFSEKPYRQRVTRLWFQMMSMTLVILMVALIVSYLSILRLTRPLQTLSLAAEKIDESNLETHVNVGGRAKVSKLASSFNGMLRRLKDYTQRLETSKQKLEEKKSGTGSSPSPVADFL